ncbi:unnamed protein product [Paramecium primaurelia]|uniref:Maleylacetoacetate isomerase n=1 Tax=Paramecium primaurelia TaxID=5886 RepID=A0A8S1KYK9_PARPR|nr:unnamed protein product [Paramecium primaurelia]
MQQKLKLYTYFRSSTSHRIRIVLNLKEIDYEPKFVNLLTGEHKSEDNKEELPNQAVPALHIPDGTILIESMAIAEYLDEVYPQKKLLPQDPVLKAKVRGFCELINSGMHPYQNLILFEWIEKYIEKFDRVEFVQNVLKSEFQTMEKLLLQNHGKYSFGDEITLADCFLVPQVMGAIARFKLDISLFPTIQEVYNNLKDLPQFYKAQPDQQPDFK